MKNTNLITSLIFLFAIVSFTGCDKDSNNKHSTPTNPVEVVKKQLSQVINSSFSKMIDYDEQGRPVKVRYDNGQNDTIIYNENSVVFKYYYDDPQNMEIGTLPLNSQAYISKLFGITISYDENNYMQIPGLIWKDENISSFSGEMEGLRFQASAEYYTDKFNLEDISQLIDGYIEFGHTISSLLGKTSKNLVKSVKYEFNNDVYDFQENFSYEFDSDGYITKLTITNPDAEGEFVYNFQWSSI